MDLRDYITVLINKYYHTDKKSNEVKHTKETIINILHTQNVDVLNKICRLNWIKIEVFSDYYKLKRVKLNRIEWAFNWVKF